MNIKLEPRLPRRVYMSDELWELIGNAAGVPGNESRTRSPWLESAAIDKLKATANKKTDRISNLPKAYRIKS